MSFIDLGGMGSNVQATDIEYFRESIKLLAKTYGVEFERRSTDSFLQGYDECS